MKKLFVLALMATLLTLGSAFAQDRASPFMDYASITQANVPAIDFLLPLDPWGSAKQLAEAPLPPVSHARAPDVQAVLPVNTTLKTSVNPHGETPAEISFLVLHGPDAIKAGTSTGFAWLVHLSPRGDPAPVMLASRQSAMLSHEDLALPKRFVPRARDCI